MKNKGFTLIELLAVIVILAIIALIAVPIIINIINDSRDKANQRSVEMYRKAIENAVARYALAHPEESLTGTYSSSTTDRTKLVGLNKTDFKIDYTGSTVICSSVIITSEGEVQVSNCTVNGKAVGNATTQPTLTRYYYNTELDTSSNVSDGIPEGATTNSFGRFAFDTYDGQTIEAAYVCFETDGTEYCLKGMDPDEYENNQQIISTGLSVHECSGIDDESGDCLEDCPEGYDACNGVLSARADASGNVTLYRGGIGYQIRVNGDYGSFQI